MVLISSAVFVCALDRAVCYKGLEEEEAKKRVANRSRLYSPRDFGAGHAPLGGVIEIAVVWF